MARLVVTAPLLLVLASACAPAAVVDVGRGEVAPPTGPGPYLVVERELEEGGRLYIPSSSNAEMDRALLPLPFVVFAPGFSAKEGDYRATLRHVASHGFVVLGQDHGFDFLSATFCMTQREGLERVKRGIARVRLHARRDGDELEGLVDPFAPIGTVGHSYGGKIALWLSVDGEHVGATFALDPVDGGDERRPGYCEDRPQDFPPVAALLPGEAMPPVAIVTAGRSGDCAPSSGNGAVLFGALDDDALHLSLPEATHTDFVDDAEDGDCAVCGLCPASGEDAADVLRLVRGGVVAFLRHRLLHDDDAAGWQLPGSPLGVVPADAPPAWERTQK